MIRVCIFSNIHFHIVSTAAVRTAANVSFRNYLQNSAEIAMEPGKGNRDTESVFRFTFQKQIRPLQGAKASRDV